MKRILLSLGLLSAFAVTASAVGPINLTITNPQSENFGVISQGVNYNVYGTITGVQVDVVGYSFVSSFPLGNPATGFSFTPSTALTNYIALTTTADFGTLGNAGYDPIFGNGGGLLGTIRLLTTATPGQSYTNVLGVNESNIGDGENLTAIAATPEPASLAALGVGAVALLRRRKKA